MNRPLTFTDYDNLGRVAGRSVYDGDGIQVIDANTDGVPRQTKKDRHNR